jgi:hypothetical protein
LPSWFFTSGRVELVGLEQDRGRLPPHADLAEQQAVGDVARRKGGIGAQEAIVIENERLDVPLHVVHVGVLFPDRGEQGVLPRDQGLQPGGGLGDDVRRQRRGAGRVTRGRRAGGGGRRRRLGGQFPGTGQGDAQQQPWMERSHAEHEWNQMGQAGEGFVHKWSDGGRSVGTKGFKRLAANGAGAGRGQDF